MLNWIAGSRPNEAVVSGNAKRPNGFCLNMATYTNADIDSTAPMDLDIPETPAPTFAVRAFKHAIFGTPQTAKPKPRSRSNTEKERPRVVEERLVRPINNRPKSSGDQFKQDSAPAEREPMPSPTKGILMTPGTAAARRKTVSFGEQVKDNEQKKDSKSGLPDDCPGKFPSPWVQPAELPLDSTQASTSRGRSKLTEALEQARDESAKRNSNQPDKPTSEIGDHNDLTTDLTEPHSQAGKYWKNEYDLYRENTQREVKKLVAKQKAAKSFAKEKDAQCTDLMDQLRQEKRRADRLEKRSQELEAQLREFREKLRVAELGKSEATERTTNLNQRLDGTWRQHRPTSKDDSREKSSESPIRPPLWEGRATSPSKNSESPLKLSERPHLSRHERSKSHEPMTIPKEEGDSQHGADNARQYGRSRTRPEKAVDQALKAEVDIWAQSFTSSTPGQTQDQSPERPKVLRSVTCGTNATPLKNLSVNSLSADKKAENARRARRNDREAQTQSLLPTKEAARPTMEDKRKDSLDVSLDLPLPSPELSPSPVRSKQDQDTQSGNVPPSSPFEPHVESKPLSERFRSLRRTDEKTPPKPPVHQTMPAAAKENVSPTRAASTATTEQGAEIHKAQGGHGSQFKPATELRIASATARDGRQVSNDRLEAARARLQAKGNRYVS